MNACSYLKIKKKSDFGCFFYSTLNYCIENVLYCWSKHTIAFIRKKTWVTEVDFCDSKTKMLDSKAEGDKKTESLSYSIFNLLLV